MPFHKHPAKLCIVSLNIAIINFKFQMKTVNVPKIAYYVASAFNFQVETEMILEFQLKLIILVHSYTAYTFYSIDVFKFQIYHQKST